MDIKKPHSRTFVNLKVWRETHEIVKALARLRNTTVCGYMHELAVQEGHKISVQTKAISDDSFCPDKNDNNGGE